MRTKEREGEQAKAEEEEELNVTNSRFDCFKGEEEEEVVEAGAKVSLKFMFY